ncbi:MAG: hypothetical protein MUP15_07175 [Dehalococcoidia bacterium]|nr:hypothetical protein [Dehalococcoidia bacterium]
MRARNVTRLLLLGLAAVIAAGTLTSFSVVRDSSVTRANMPRPVQPFAAQAIGGVSTTQLGQSIAASQVVTQVLKGERTTIPAVFSGPGFSVDPDTGPPYDVSPPPPLVPIKPLGTVWSSVDVNCDGQVDLMYDGIAQTPLTWLEATTNKGALGPAAFLLPIMPPWPWIARHKVDIGMICIGTVPPWPLVATNSVLNTVYAQVPFSPGGGAFVAATKLGGAPTTPPSNVCLDSPQTSESITTLYNNPPLNGVDANWDGLDDNSGLYVRWTALQSVGSTSLNQPGDLRKSFQSPPSFPSDTGYVERFVQLECYWLDDDGCDATHGDCDADDSGFISPEESWNDPDLVTLGGKTHVDADGDCLMNGGHVQPGWPAVDAVDTPTGVTCDSSPNWVRYSEDPVWVQHDTAADQDCDGLLDGIEWAWGSSQVDADTDDDGAADFVEMFQFTDPTDTDSDADGLLDRPDDDYLAAAAGSAETGESVNLDDNCPTVANPGQENNDGKRRDNGIKIPNLDASNPNQDKLGDACDEDDDNDGATDAYENDTTGGKVASNPLKPDTDGDTVNDGAEWRLGTNPNDPAAWPAWGAAQQVYYRGCQINVPAQGAYPAWDAEYDGLENGVEMDVDGDGIVCQSGGSIVDADSDNGWGTGGGAACEIIDQVEAFGYGTGVANKDSDGDGCEDWIEIVDVDGNRTANVGDLFFIANRAFNLIPPPDPVSDSILDIDKNGLVTVVDVMLAVKNSGPLKWPSTCGPEG